MISNWKQTEGEQTETLEDKIRRLLDEDFTVSYYRQSIFVTGYLPNKKYNLTF